MICPKCNSIFYFIKHNNSRICECETCGFIGSYIKPVYKNYHRIHYSNKILRSVKTDPMIKRIILEMNFFKNDKVLDYGCGIGEYTNEISKIANNTIGVDISIKRAKKIFPNNIFLKQKNKNINFSDNYFNKIICVNTIEHILDYESLLEEFERVLDKKGLLFITTYNRNFILHKLNYDMTHVKEWDVEEFKEMVGKYFKIKKCFKFGTFFNYYPYNKLLVKFIKPEICILAEKK